MSASHLSAGQKLAVQAGSRMPLAPGMQGGDPVFEQVTRTAREINNMVPV